jgi:hypothetical protein
MELKTEDIEIPELEETIRLRELTGTERDRYEGEIVGDGTTRNFENVRAGMVARSIIDPETGERVFHDADIPVIGKWPASVLDKLFTVCQRLSGLRGEDLEDLRKNSGGDPSEDSTPA